MHLALLGVLTTLEALRDDGDAGLGLEGASDDWAGGALESIGADGARNTAAGGSAWPSSTDDGSKHTSSAS